MSVNRHGHGGWVLGCRCEVCVDCRRIYNRQWMAQWRARKRQEATR
jgi:hypothetical protein